MADILHRVVSQHTPSPNLLELAAQLNLTTCIENLQLAKVDRVLNHEGWFTLFCPTNEAFAREKIYPGEDTMVDKMRMHVARGMPHTEVDDIFYFASRFS
jgi:uncharacterized surface protein with fasciclin (FAS1) repeats